MLHYQPLVSAENHQPDGFEALVRWNHPIRGIVPPAEFIPIAEQSGLIQQIGDWTIYEACHAAARWPAHMGVAVNMSAKHFQMSDIASVVKRALTDSGLAPERLELEITESLLIVESRRGDRQAEGNQDARHFNRHGRFRHRIFEPVVPAQIPVRQDQDRQIVRDGLERGRRRAGHPADHRVAGEIAEDPDHGRGRRDPGSRSTSCANSPATSCRATISPKPSTRSTSPSI